jgi:F-type H+-transporting ATPase subunit b
VPQFDPNTFLPQLFWLIVTFGLLYVIVGRAILPRIAGVLEARQKRIDDDLDRAAAVKDDAESVLATYEKTMADGKAEAQGLLRQAAEEMAAEAAKRHEGLAAKLAEDVGAAEARILEAKTAAVDNIGQVAGEVAQAAIRRLIGVEIDQASAGKAVKAAMRGEG